ncbi:MAG TPA: dipeptidase [Ignavibacteria bacterium]|nr:dipeptidase [Bacteroidota bacterium]HRI85680.1 dipeptidase [Ignavibacteria bacterium]HRJ98257.1 dipeptidase [Ignavibacteria bacterium]
MDKIIEYIESNKDKYIEDLKVFLRIPSISTNPENKNDVRNCAEYVERQLKSIGLENIAVYETPGHPVVYGDWLNAGEDKPTILIYGHYDVQPVDPVNLWTDPPFEPTVRDGNIYARGSADDKGQVFIHMKSIEAHLVNNGKLPVNIKFLIEGEEEIGSVNLDEFILKNKSLLKCDYVVVSDSAMFDYDVPSICYGLRGLAYMQVEVTGPNRDLHSGSFGGAVNNPINALAHIIVKLKDDKGKILIDGFYDDVLKLSDKEREEFKKLPFNEKKYMEELEVSELFGEEGYTTLERASARPTLDCNGIWGGFQGEGAKTVLPSQAGAKISMRLVPNQEPEKIEKLFTDYVKKISPDSVKVKVLPLHGGKGAITPIDSPAIDAAVEALRLGFGKTPVFTREGGSIPVVNTFQTLLGADTILLGFGLPDENAHSPDEHLNLSNFQRGILSIAHYFNELSKIKK